MLKPTSHLSLSFSMCVYKKKRLLYTWLVCLWHFRTAQSKYEEKKKFLHLLEIVNVSLSWWLKKETRCWSATLMMMMTVSKTPPPPPAQQHRHLHLYSIPFVTSSKPTNNYEKESSSFHSKLVNYKRPRANGSVFPTRFHFLPFLPPYYHIYDGRRQDLLWDWKSCFTQKEEKSPPSSNNRNEFKLISLRKRIYTRRVGGGILFD